MKFARVLVLLLVCLLLPLRGTLAATLLCAQPSSAATDRPHHATPCDASGMNAGSRMHDHPHGAGHDSAHPNFPNHGDDAHGKNDVCHVCCASACAAALTAPAPDAPGALPALATVFPALQVPAPDFESDAQERPPRGA